MKTSRIVLFNLIFYFIGVLLLTTTSSQHIPIVILVLPFVIFFAAFTLSVMLIMKYLNNEKTFVFTRKRLLRAGLVASLPIISLVLTSIGQFSYFSFITLLILFAVASFYVNRAT